MLRLFSLRLFLSIIPLFTAFPLLADDLARPTIPEAGEDLLLTGGKSAAAFFHERAQDSTCQQSLKEAHAKYLDTKTEDARNTYLTYMEQCGFCASRFDRRIIPTPLKTEHWYIADGSCELPMTDTAQLLTSYQRAMTSLQHIKQYPVKTGGFPDVLELVAVDPGNQALQLPAKLLPDVDLEPTSPFFSFIAVRGPEFIPGVPTALTYFFRNDFAESTRSGQRYFQLKFTSMDIPGLAAPDVFLGTEKVRQMRLKSVQGTWILNASGYARYYTAADFPVDMEFAQKLARHILLNTLVTLAERSLPEGL